MPGVLRKPYLPMRQWLGSGLLTAGLLGLMILATAPQLTRDLMPLQEGVTLALWFVAIGVWLAWCWNVLRYVAFQAPMILHGLYALFLAGLLYVGLFFIFLTYDTGFMGPTFQASLFSHQGAVRMDFYETGRFMEPSDLTLVRISDGDWPVTREWATLRHVQPCDLRLQVEGDRIELRDADGDVLAHSLRGENATMVAAED